MPHIDASPVTYARHDRRAAVLEGGIAHAAVVGALLAVALIGGCCLGRRPR